MAQSSDANSSLATASVHQSPSQEPSSSTERQPLEPDETCEENDSMAESEAETEIADDELAARSRENNETYTTADSKPGQLGSSDDLEDEEDRYWAEFHMHRKRPRPRRNSQRDSLSSAPTSLSDWERSDDSNLSSNHGSSSDDSQSLDGSGSRRRRRQERKRNRHGDADAPTREKRKRGRPRKSSRSEEDDKQRRMSTESISTPTTATENEKRKGRRLGKNPNRTDKAGRTLLFKATSAGHYDIVKDLVAQGANVNIRDNAGWTPLHEAALKGQLQIAKYFIERHADVNARGFGGDTPLHDACSNSFAGCVRVLIDAGADVFALNDKKERPLDVCDDDECRAILHEKMNQLDRRLAKDDKGRTLLHRACESGEVNKVQSLIREGADVNAKDNALRAPLHEAVLHNHVAVALTLVDHGADVNCAGHQGNTPLHYASQQGYEECVRRLIDAGADVMMNNDDGKNAYSLTGSPTIRRVLTEKMDEARQRKEAEENDALDSQAVMIARKGRHRESEGERPLTREERKIQAYMRVFENMERPRRARTMETVDSQEEVPLPAAPRKKRTYRRRKSESFDSRECSAEPETKAKKVDPSKFDPKKKDTSGRTYLHKWAKRGECSVVEALLRNGANANETDNAGWTPLHEAALRGHVDVVRILLDNGAQVNSKSADQDTALHDAAENNHDDVVTLLLQRGADPHASNASQKTPLAIAVDNENEHIERIISKWIGKQKKAKSIQKKTKERNGAEKKAQSGKPFHSKTRSDTLLKDERVLSALDCLPRKRRLVKAAHLESRSDENEKQTSPTKDASLDRTVHVDADSGSSGETTVKKETTREVDGPSTNERHVPLVSCSADLPARTPIPTPPPESWHLSGKAEIKKEREEDTTRAMEDPMRYLPLYTVHLLDESCHVVDLQVSMLIRISTEELWHRYPHLWRRPMATTEKERLWSHLAPMLCSDDSQLKTKRERFMETVHYFIRLDEAVTLIKADFHDLSEKLITILLDIGYREEYRKRQLPPKLAMKMKKWGAHLPASESPC